MKKYILVTGAHRSGSTWIGDIISVNDNINYVHEPFNIGIKVYKSPFRNWYEYVNSDCPVDYQDQVYNYILSFSKFPKIRFFLSALRIGAPKYNQNILKDIRSAFWSSNVLIKDPIALMSSEWMYEKFDAKVLITVRHPAAFIASLKVKNWRFAFNNFLLQESLMSTYLVPYREQIEELASNEGNIIKQGIVLWNSIYSVVSKFRERYKNKWYYIKHEDLSRNPMGEFENIFKYLELDFNQIVKDKIVETTTSLSQEVGKRDSKTNISTWKTRLTDAEIDLIKKECYPVWSLFYTEDDW